MKTNELKKGLTRLVLIAVVVLGLNNVSNAQWQYGFKLGAGATCQSDMLEIANNCDVRFSPTVGFITKYQLTEGFALKSGLEYMEKGRSFEENGIDLSKRLQYLNLPLKAEFSAGEKAGFKKGQRVFFAMGPYVSYLLDAKGELNGADFDLKSDTKEFDLGLAFELGMEFPVFNEKALQVALNYDMGFVEVYETAEYSDLHNKMASISLGLLF